MDTTRGNRSFAYFGGASKGEVTAGLLLTSVEAAGGYFKDFISCNTDAGTVFNVDRRGTVSFGRLKLDGTTINPSMHMTLQSDYSLGWLNADRSVQLLNLNQNGDLGVFGRMAAGGLSVANVAQIQPGNAAETASNWNAGSLFVDGGGRLLYCDQTGVAPKAVSLGGGAGGGSSAVMRFDKTSARTDSRIFSRDNQAVDAGAYQLTEIASPQNAATGANIIGHHVRHVAQGSTQNGHRMATIASGVSVTKEGFGTTGAAAGEIDGLYVVTRQDGPRNNGQNNAWGVVIDTAGHQNVGWMGGIAGSTSILSNTVQNANGGGETVQQLGYHIGSIEDGANRAIGLDVYAGKGALTAGLQVVNQEANGGYFANFLECVVDTTKVFQIDRDGFVGIGGRYSDDTKNAPQVHLRTQKDGSFTITDAGKATASVTVTQDGSLYARTGLYAAAIQSSGNIVAGGAVQAARLDLSPGGDPSNGASGPIGRLFVGPSGRLRYYDGSTVARYIVMTDA